MKQVKLKPCNPFFLTEQEDAEILLGKEDYLERIHALLERAKQAGLSHVVLYGDREHFATMDYFSGVDCRFEEALLIFDREGRAHILVGNEGISQTYSIPYEVEMHLYQNFSLPGQTRDEQEDLSTIMKKTGIDANSRVGMVGYKFFEKKYIPTDPAHTYDIPAYIMDAVFSICPEENVQNFTEEVIGFPNGIRLQLRTAKEIARIEGAGNRSAAVVQRMLKKLAPGITERQLAFGVAGLEAVNVHPMVNFGAEKVRIGVSSPGDRALVLGEVCGICYGARYSLTSRVGIAATGPQDVQPSLQPHLDFYRAGWHAVAEVLGTLCAGAKCADIYEAAMRHIGAPEYNVTLNITHYSGADEWLNSPVWKNSPHTIHDGAHIQLDIIASNPSPVRSCICEDAVVVAGPRLRQKLQEEYPQVWERIAQRQEMIRQELGIELHDDVLPMSNLTSVYFPYMLNRDSIFTLEG